MCPRTARLQVLWLRAMEVRQQGTGTLGRERPILLTDPRGNSLLKCGEEELVRQINTLFGRNAQVVYELQVQEEMEGVRQEVREIESKSKARKDAHMNMNMWTG